MALAPLPSRDVPTPLPDDPTLDGEGPEDDDPLDGRMTFLEHLDELRKRITHAVIALLSGFVVASIFSNRIQAFVYERLTADLPERKFIYTEPGEGFFLWVKISALAGALVASPYIMLQVWLFIAPGLYAKEKRLAIPFVLTSSALFVAGAAFVGVQLDVVSDSV